MLSLATRLDLREEGFGPKVMGLGYNIMIFIAILLILEVASISPRDLLWLWAMIFIRIKRMESEEEFINMTVMQR
jgi:hypothetical protein